MDTMRVLIHHANVKQLAFVLVVQNVAVQLIKNSLHAISNFYFRI
jgi:hypothetical protein